MKVFISWSGNRSRAVAELLDEWIQCVLQAVSPWLSSKDIDRGSLWFSEISDQLKDTKIGIVCLTQSNKNKPWILFESGALAKGLSSNRVCTFLIDLDSSDVGNPLAQFNHTFPTKDGIWDLVRTLNTTLGENSLRENVLDKVFETYWPQFEENFKKALEDNPETHEAKPRSEESILVEVLNTVRSMQHKIRQLETSPKSPQQKTRRMLSPTGIRVQVEEMFSNGLEPSDIQEALRGRAPQDLVNQAIMNELGITDEDVMDACNS
jgi:hypothetical protein